MTDERNGSASKRTSDEEREIMSTAGNASERSRGFGSSVAMPTERSENFSESFRRLGRLLAPQKWMIAFVVLLAVASVALVVIGPRLLGQATDIIVRGVGSGDGVDFGALHRKLVLIGGLYIASWILTLLQGYLLAGVVQRSMHALRERVEQKLNRLPLEYMDSQPRGDFLSRVTNDIDNLSQSLQQSMSMMVTSVLSLVGIAAMMLWISPLMTLIALLPVPLSMWLMKMIASRARRVSCSSGPTPDRSTDTSRRCSPVMRSWRCSAGVIGLPPSFGRRTTSYTMPASVRSSCRASSSRS